MLKQEAPPVVLPEVKRPALELPTEDGIPLETAWHRAEINLLIECIRYHWRERTDFYTGGNMFIYFSLEQAEAVAREVRAELEEGKILPPSRRTYRGPDFFVVKDVDGTKQREAWVVWEEEGRYPDLIIELLSPSTARTDRTTKKALYERTFHTPEYFCYDPRTQTLEGWRLQGERYASLTPNAQGWLWSEVLQLWLGTWEGEFQREHAVWLRFFDADGNLVPTEAEAAKARARAAEARAAQEAEARRAAEARAEAAEAELARLRAELARLRDESPSAD